MNQAHLLAQFKKMQAEMQKAQEELANTVVTGTAAGGMVTVEATCDQRIRRVQIGKDAVDPEDVEMLEDLVLTGVKQAIEKGKGMAQSEMGKMTAGLGLPPGLA